MSQSIEPKQPRHMQDIFEAALKNTPDFVYVIGLDGRFIYANEALLSMWGKNEDEARGRSLLELGYAPWHAEMHNKEIEEVIKTKKPIRGEVPFTGTGGKRIYEYIFAPIFDTEGKVTAISGTTRDVTENKAAQEALRHSLEREQITTKAYEFLGVWDYDLRNNLVYSDEKFARLYSVDPAWAAKGAPIEEFTKTIHPDDMAYVGPSIQAAIEKCSDFSSEYRLVPPGKPIVWVVARGRVEKDENGVAYRFTGAVVDITERKIAEEKVLQNERQFRKLMDAVLSNTADFNYAFDLEGRFTYINKALLDLWEKSFDEALGKNFFELDYPPELAELLHRQIRQVIETKQPLRAETPYTSASGTRSYEYIFTPVFDENGNIEAVAGSTRDITSYREADRRKDEFLAMLAHELRNPLAPISNALHFLRLPTITEKRREDAAALVERQVAQMTSLLNDLLDVSRVTHGKIELRPENLALADILSMAIECVQPLIQEKGHTLHINAPEKPIFLKGDKTRLSQVFSNLLNNAAKYTNPNGTITLRAYEDEAKITITISDNGIGIPKEVQPYIFDLFSQVDSTLERTQGGLGIGLTLVKNLIEMHNGSVSVTSEGKEKGSIFTIHLPANVDIAQPSTSDKIKEEQNASVLSRHILVVDDNEASAKTLVWTMEMLGHTAQMTHDGANALKIAKDIKPDIVLLDIGLPTMNGYEVCKAMRSDPKLKNTIIIAQTGWGQKEHLQRSKEVGFDYHLVKPIKIDDLQKVLNDPKLLDKTA